MNTVRTLCCLIFALSCQAVGGQEIDFNTQVKPLFEKYCLSCHGPEDEQGFRIDIRDEALGYVEEGEGEESDLYTVLIDEDEDIVMPPPSAHNPMSEPEIELVKAWIDEGGSWPEDTGVWVDNSPKTSDLEMEQTERVKRVAGSLHPAVVHLPIGLLLASGLFAFLSLRGNFVMSDCAYYCLWLGALGAIVASVSGWFYANPLKGYPGVEGVADIIDPKHSEIYWHRLTGLIATVASLILALFAASARSKDPDDGLMWKLGAILLAVGIGYVGHEGGELTHPGLYDDAEVLIESLFEEEGGAPSVDDADPELELEAANSEET